MGVRVGSEWSREIYGRLLMMKHILEEHKKLTEGEEQAPTNGQPDEDD